MAGRAHGSLCVLREPCTATRFARAVVATIEHPRPPRANLTPVPHTLASPVAGSTPLSRPLASTVAYRGELASGCPSSLSRRHENGRCIPCGSCITLCSTPARPRVPGQLSCVRAGIWLAGSRPASACAARGQISRGVPNLTSHIFYSFPQVTSPRASPISPFFCKGADSRSLPLPQVAFSPAHSDRVAGSRPPRPSLLLH